MQKMNNAISNLVAGNVFIIDEKVGFFKTTNEYKIYNEQGIQIGIVKEKKSTKQKILSLMISKKMMPFKLELIDTSNNVIATISRGWTFFMSKIKIESDGSQIAEIVQKFKLLKPSFMINNSSGQMFAKISGNFTAKSFEIEDADGRPIGIISKKFAGLKELFSTADKYNIYFTSAQNDLNKLAILAASITIDMVFHEKD